ncbi:hypothetical protein [Lysinibacillus sphaericus]|uniref:hypothetical protein n=1 Tax=Lysinibacillus sphaericus TaxID=1421 RepID=UPI0015D4D48F|nr:hypothetical protein [Lysinibacillus sphaericus]
MADVKSLEHIQNEIKKTFAEEYRKTFNEEYTFTKKEKEKSSLKRVVVNVYGIKSNWI